MGEHVEEWYRRNGRWEDATRMIELRVDYQRKVYTDPIGTLAWTLESLADMLLQRLGFDAKPNTALQTSDVTDVAKQEDIAGKVTPVLEESMRILRLMFGCDHEHFTSV